METSSEKLSENVRRQGREARCYRQFFAARWRDFIRANFDGPAHVALVFRVDPATAANWFEGLNAPQGWVVAMALTDPGLAPGALAHLGAGCGKSDDG